MYQPYVLLLALLASSITALPLNINLGAYSPALVVGDGEISFGGKQDVSNLMNALQGAAIGAASTGAAAAITTPANTAAAVAQPATIASTPIEDTPTTQMTALQGMGKEIAPRVVPFIQSTDKRDLASFNAALAFASAALKTSPEIQLGTGEGGSGVGITQKAGGVTTAKAAGRRRRELTTAAPKMKTTVTTMFVRGGAAPAGAETAATPAKVAGAVVGKRAPEPSPSQAIDGVNLNMAEGQVAELTFVETRTVDEAEDLEAEDLEDDE